MIFVILLDPPNFGNLVYNVFVPAGYVLCINTLYVIRRILVESSVFIHG